MKSTRWIVTYVIVASLGLWGALFMSLKFVTPSHAQKPPEAPSAGDLPPEFAQETQNPPAGNNNGQIPPPPSQPPVESQPPQQVPETPAAPNTVPVQQAPIPQPGMGEAPIVPQFASDEQYTYDPTGRRDPFKPYKKYSPSPVTAPGQAPRVIDESDPLQRWDIDRFAVVAIMWEIRQPKAMVRDPDGKMYLIGKNTKIGRNMGRVVTIREGEVVVVEEIENEGVQTKEVKVLELKK